MELEIIKLLPPKESQKEGVYSTVQMLDRDTGKFYQTYLVKGYRNYQRWESVAKVGNVLRFYNPKMKGDNLIDADSSFNIIKVGIIK